MVQLAKTELYTDSQPDPEDPSEHINSHAFAANLFERRIFTTDISWAIWALRDAHTKTPKMKRAASVMVTCQQRHNGSYGTAELLQACPIPRRGLLG